MIRGVVNARREAVICVRLRGPSGIEADVDTIVDTGFTSSLTLPAAEVSALGLVRQSGSRAVLADGSTRHFDVYAAEVLWGGEWRPVLVSAVGGEALLGMQLLAGYKLCIEAIPGGEVDLTSLS